MFNWHRTDSAAAAAAASPYLLLTKRVMILHGELLAPRPTPNLEDHPLRLSATA